MRHPSRPFICYWTRTATHKQSIGFRVTWVLAPHASDGGEKFDIVWGKSRWFGFVVICIICDFIRNKLSARHLHETLASCICRACSKLEDGFLIGAKKTSFLGIYEYVHKSKHQNANARVARWDKYTTIKNITKTYAEHVCIFFVYFRIWTSSKCRLGFGQQLITQAPTCVYRQKGLFVWTTTSRRFIWNDAKNTRCWCFYSHKYEN